MTPQLCPFCYRRCPTPPIIVRKPRASCWKTKRESRAALGYPVFPNERPVQRSRNETENYTDDDPGKQIGLLLFIHLVHRELTLLRSRRLRVAYSCLCHSVSSRRNTRRRVRLRVAAPSGKPARLIVGRSSPDCQLRAGQPPCWPCSRDIPRGIA